MLSPDHIIIPSGYKIQIMQGNTESASDCVALENAIEAADHEYNIIGRYGWSENSNYPASTIVTASNFAGCNFYDVAYYTGHGASVGMSLSTGEWVLVPALNYGHSQQINVASVLGVAEDDWESACIFDSSDQLRVLMLAACNQLTDNLVKYYARIMRASGVRAVLGYWGTGPGTGIDDAIASAFVSYCDAEIGVKDAWACANNDNGNRPWAALVYAGNNINYRLPGFPGTTYSTPTSLTPIYRFASSISGGSTVSTSSLDDALYSVVCTLPYAIAAADMQSVSTLQEYNREAVWGNTSVADDDSEVRKLLNTALGEDIANKPCVQYNVSREEVDPDEGIISDTKVIVERTYQYFDTYNGIKVADSYISVSIDGEGINDISVHRRSATSYRINDVEMDVSSSNAAEPITVEAALKVVYDHSCATSDQLYNISLAYVPDGSGRSVLCYEFMFSDGFRYVNIMTGETVND